MKLHGKSTGVGYLILKVKVKSLSRVQLFVTPWTVDYQATPSVGFSRQEYWSGLPFPSEVKIAVMSDSLWSHGLYSPCNSPGQNTGVGSWSLFQGIFPTQGSNWGLLYCRRIPYQLKYPGSLDLHLITLHVTSFFLGFYSHKSGSSLRKMLYSLFWGVLSI